MSFLGLPTWSFKTAPLGLANGANCVSPRENAFGVFQSSQIDGLGGGLKGKPLKHFSLQNCLRNVAPLASPTYLWGTGPSHHDEVDAMGRKNALRI